MNFRRHLDKLTALDCFSPIISSKFSRQITMGTSTSSDLSAYGQDFRKIVEWLRAVPTDAEQLMFPNKRCIYCQRSFADKKCGNCKRPYCSQECQFNDWSTHRFTCAGPSPPFLRRCQPPPGAATSPRRTRLEAASMAPTAREASTPTTTPSQGL